MVCVVGLLQGQWHRWPWCSGGSARAQTAVSGGRAPSSFLSGVCWFIRTALCNTCQLIHTPAMATASHGPDAVFGFTVRALNDGYADGVRDIDCVELFSGVGSVWRAAQDAGFAAVGFDKTLDPSQDIGLQSGFLLAARLVLRIRPSGLLWLAPMCSSFCWLCVSTTVRKRHNDYVGDLKNPHVVAGNHAAMASVLLMSLAVFRGVHCILENPVGSRMWPFLTCAQAIRFPTWGVVCNRCAFEEAPLGEKLYKRYRLVGTALWTLTLRRPCTCQSHAHRLSSRRSRRQPRRCSGNLAVLQESGAYPCGLGVAVVQAWQAGITASAGSAAAGSAAAGSAVHSAGSSAGVSVASAAVGASARTASPKHPALMNMQGDSSENEGLPMSDSSGLSLRSSASSAGLTVDSD